MRQSFFFLLFLPAFLGAQELDSLQRLAEVRHLVDSINGSFRWQTEGPVLLGKNLATLALPQGWRYLPADQSNMVLSEFWNNPPDESSLGMLFPIDCGPLDNDCLAFNLTFDSLGYVKDDDADDIDYKDLLQQIQKDAQEENKKRVELGYPAVTILGWASAPFYDKERKVLHWAKEFKMEGDNGIENSLNYDVRVLGRKGVLSMNAIGTIGQLDRVKQHVPAVIAAMQFNEGHRYGDFKPGLDEVAAWTLGGLVAGKILAKAGFFAIILKFLKPILLVLFGGGAALWRRMAGRRKEA